MNNMNNQSRARMHADYIMNKKQLVFQVMRFGIVGVIAAVIHYSVVLWLVQNFSYRPLSANILGYLAGFQMSYLGHRYFTFNETTTMHTAALAKLLLLQSFNFIVNESLYYFLLSLHLSYQLALLIVLAVLPLFTFTISKWWVFR